MVGESAATFANPAVLEFYRLCPFNLRESPEQHAQAIRSADATAAYPVLPPLLGPGVRVLEVGCGTGWFSNAMALHHHAIVHGIDFNPVAIEQARAVAQVLRLPTTFEVADLFRFETTERFDVVVSLGVLHHTDDCMAGVRRLCERLVRPGGHVLVGLYHIHGRAPFLAHFAALKAAGASTAELLARYRTLHAEVAADETHLQSWFRDQVLHPHETQHTLAEMLPVLAEANMELTATSLNRFGPVEPIASVLQAEEGYRELAQQRLRANRFFPGFFVFLARRRAH